MNTLQSKKDHRRTHAKAIVRPKHGPPADLDLHLQFPEAGEDGELVRRLPRRTTQAKEMAGQELNACFADEL
jgi:hypothetical protein